MVKNAPACAICNGSHELVEFKGTFVCKHCIDHVKTEA